MLINHDASTELYLIGNENGISVKEIFDWIKLEIQNVVVITKKDIPFLKKYFPCILFSDNRIIAKTNHLLDDDLKINLAKEFKYRANEPYGYSLTCISNNISKTLS